MRGEPREKKDEGEKKKRKRGNKVGRQGEEEWRVGF